MSDIAQSNDPISALTNILIHEKELLSSGDINQVSELLDLKMTVWRAFERELSTYSSSPPSAQKKTSIEKIIALAKENAAHYESIRRGLQSVTARLQGIGSSAYVGAYDETGRRVAFSGASGNYRNKV